MLKQVATNQSTGNDEKATNIATKFMKLYGSHIQYGCVDLGPIFEYAIVFHSEKGGESTELAKTAESVLEASEKGGEFTELAKTAKTVLEASSSLKGSACGIWYDATDILKTDDPNTYAKLQKIRVRVTQIGCHDRTDLARWQEEIKKGTCHIGLIQSEVLCPIWEIAVKEGSPHKDATSLKKYLADIWQNEIKCMAHSEQDLMLQALGLVAYQDVGIAVEEARALTLVEKLPSDNMADIPWLMMSKLMLSDHRARHNDVIKNILKKHKSSLPDILKFHTMDVFLLTFVSCDVLLRQMLVHKMAQCRLAIPFIVPSAGGRLELSLWPLRSIAVTWMLHNDKVKDESHKDKAMEVSLVKYPFKMLSFIRLGEISVSKSKTLNEILSLPVHDTFFHKDASGGTKDRQLCNGLIEMTYHLPQNNDDILRETLILNLRGDGSQLKNHLSLLSSISSVLVCCVEVQTMSNESKRAAFQTLTDIKTACPNIVVILLGKDDDDTISNKLRSNNMTVVQQYDSDDEGFVSASDLVRMTKETIAKSLSDSTKSCISLLDQRYIYRKHGIVIDEDINVICQDLEQQVSDIVSEINTKDMATAKAQLLPAQGRALHKWSGLLRKQHREIENCDAEDSQVQKDKNASAMCECRKNQLQDAFPVKTIMTKFISAQQLVRPRLSKTAFLKYLKLELDDLSRRTLPGLRQIYKAAWTDKNTNPKAFAEAKMKLDDSSFGSEHLFREIGQLYECLREQKNLKSQEQDQLMKKLPLTAAEYIISGHPFELMDGDSGIVPLPWVHAVFDALSKVIGGKKMFVLAVIGVQSTGKSTLLNAMFGLELAVGAGRCTKGIYAHLVPVNRSLADLNVDYILVIDSEGLCGSVSDNGRHEHDNEIATLVIGLADLTIVNIKGENTQQMKEMFEIAVHAFLRMKTVQDWKKLKCIFLHQAVAAVTANQDLMTERHALQDHLNDITKEAAAKENVEERFSQFHHVIDFNCERDVFYIPDLWNGVPPMAHVSTGYTEKIKKIRDFILTEVEISECSVSSAKMKTRTEDIWNGVLADNFVFSFKNSQSVKAYLMLESEYYKLKRSAESDLQKCVNKSKLSLENCEDATNLKETFEREKQNLRKKISEISAQSKKSFNAFFESSEAKDVKECLHQWRGIREIEMGNEIKILGNHMETELKYHHDCKNFKLSTLMINKDEVIQQIHDVSNMLKDKKYDDHKIKQEFNKVWTKWEEKLQLDKATSVFNVKDEMNSALQDIFKTRGHTMYLIEEMKNRNKKSGGGKVGIEQLEIGDMKKEYIERKTMPKEPEKLESKQKEKDEPKTTQELSDTSQMWKGTDLIPKATPRANFFPWVVEATNKSFKELETMISVIATTNIRFIPSFGHDVIKFILEAVDKQNRQPYEVSPITLTPLFKAMVAIRAADMATISFETLDDNFKNTLSLEAQMKAFRQQLENQFMNSVKEKKTEGAVGVICDKLRAHIESHLFEDIPRKAIDRILDEHKYKKHTLQVKLLSSLADKQSFTEYMEMKNDIFAYSAKWLEFEMNKMLFSSVHGTSQYGTFAKEYLDSMIPSVLDRITEVVREAKSNSWDTREFVQKLQTHIKDDVLLSNSDCQLLQIFSTTDFDGFLSLATEKINALKEEVLQQWKAVTKDTVTWKGKSPSTQAMDKLWGCKESCPRCRSPCIYTYKAHLEDQKNHRCLQHWPGGIHGIRWDHSKKLSTDTCNFLISTNATYRCGVVQYKCRESGNCKPKKGEDATHKYNEYKEYLKNWDIENDPTGTATKYWQWVMNKFQYELTKHYQTKAPDIPTEWKSIGQSEAVNSLNQYSDEDFCEIGMTQ